MKWQKSFHNDIFVKVFIYIFFYIFTFLPFFDLYLNICPAHKKKEMRLLGLLKFSKFSHALWILICKSFYNRNTWTPRVLSGKPRSRTHPTSKVRGATLIKWKSGAYFFRCVTCRVVGIRPSPLNSSAFETGPTMS